MKMANIQKPKTQKLSNKKIRKTLKKKRTRSKNSEKPKTLTVPESGPGTPDSDFDTETLPELLETYTRDQLIDLISEAALENSSFRSFVCRHADRDASRRKLFVYGLAWETTGESLASAFELYGEIEDCNVVIDKATGKCKGYGFVLFKKRKSATKALKDPKKKIHNRIASCQLASVGSISAAKDVDQTHQKKPTDMKHINAEEPAVLFPPQMQQQSEVLAALAATQNFPLLGRSYPIYGGLLGSESSPVMTMGATSKMPVAAVSTVPASHVGPISAAKDVDQTHQKKPGDVKNIHAAEPSVLFPPQPQQQSQMLAALAARQNFPLFGHNNPIYGSLLGSQINQVSTMGSTSKMPVTAVPTLPVSHVDVVGGGFGRANLSFLGQSVAGQGLQHIYPNLQAGQQPGAGRGQGSSRTGALSGYPTYN
ncbi:hypothetical protein DITRI_Ditri18aG0055700 [Diplodiscus trichospermus]